MKRRIAANIAFWSAIGVALGCFWWAIMWMVWTWRS